MTTTLVLVRHGEIVRPPYTSNFDRAPLSRRGEEQVRSLAGAWPVGRPAAIFASPLRRSIESAIILADAFGLSMSKRPCLKEWSADESGIPQPEYAALEKKAWADQDFIPPSKESLAQAAVRGTRCLESIAKSNDGQTVVVACHGMLFSLVTASLKGERPSEAYKNSIGFGAAALVEAGSGLRLISDFRRYGSGSA
ncbi:MAG: histidine phosphatase family protein [Methanobacteriota archaeon]|nr:MAG: histidine phosphatase family protein [Euryarchaeota archaeon]